MNGTSVPVARVESRPAATAQSPVEFWSEVTRLASENRRLRTIIESVAFVSISGDDLTLAVSPELMPVARGGAKDIESLAQRVRGSAVRVTLQDGTGGRAGPAEAGGVDGANRSAGSPSRGVVGGSAGGAVGGPDMRQHPLVKQAEELFGARVVKVQRTSEPRPENG